MFDTSKDILYLVIAFCVLWFTVFLCWLLYYFISIVGGVRKLVKMISEKVEKIDKLIDMVQDKVEHSASYLPLIVDGIGKLVSHFKDKKDPTPTPAPEKESKEEKGE